MLKNYWRSYPYFLQLILFMLMIFIMVGVSTVLVFTIIPKMGIALTQITGINSNSSKQVINAALVFQAISSLGVFLAPALIFAYLAHPRPTEYLGLRAPGKPVHWLLTAFIMIGAMPFFLEIEALMQHFNFGANAKAMQQQNNDIINAFLNMPTFADFLKAFVIMAIIPAIGEELFFRGIFLRFTKKRSRNMIYPVLFTSLIFAFAHSTVYGFASIFLAGCLLAVIYYLTGSILCSMLGHLLNNGLQIILMYMANGNKAIKTAMDADSLPISLLIGGVIVFSFSLFALIKTKTPLPDNWTDDYTQEELEAGTI